MTGQEFFGVVAIVAFVIGFIVGRIFTKDPSPEEMRRRLIILAIDRMDRVKAGLEVDMEINSAAEKGER